MTQSQMSVATRPTTTRTSFTLPIAAALFFATINAVAYVAAPTLFEADRARGPYTVAKNYELTRVYRRALESYQQVAKDFPDSQYYDPARIGIANSLVALGRRNEAIAEYEAILASLAANDDQKSNRLIVLAKLAAALEEAGDITRFNAVYQALSKEYPESEATRDASRFADSISAAAAQTSDSVAARSDKVAIHLDPASVGAPFRLAATVAPHSVPAGKFSIAINSAFVAQFELVSVSPASAGIQDYWGKRFFQFTLEESRAFEAVFTFKPLSAGKHSLDLDLESNFSLIELNQVISIDVAEQ